MTLGIADNHIQLECNEIREFFKLLGLTFQTFQNTSHKEQEA